MKLVQFLMMIISLSCFSQENIALKGKITSAGKPVPFTHISIEGSSKGTSATINGDYLLEVEPGTYTLKVQAVGFKTKTLTISTSNYTDKNLGIELDEDMLGLDNVVISATRNRVNVKKTPVVVNVLSPKLFNATQSIAVAESLNYQPGVRVETNCQNCGFTQVRLNGLDGSYTQVIINSRSVFSALNSVYGLEQIPTSILDRIEVVRSGGSALYGSNAIAGTVNIITKDPVLNSWEVSSNFGLIDGKTADRTFNANTSVVSEDLNSGITVYGLKRDRDSYDANDDGFSEITELTNTSLGTKSFLKPNENSKITLDLTALEEYRRGGDRLYLAPHLTDITEELNHNTIMGGITYEISNDAKTNNFSVYASGQHTDRKSFYGGLGGGRTKQDSITAANAYGNTDDLALLFGVQFTRHFKNNDVLTVGTEYNINSTEDNISGYNRYIDQEVHSLGTFAQYEWKPTAQFTALVGSRLDYVNVEGDYHIQQVKRTSKIDQTVLSPRFTVLYNFAENWRFRGGYARGFRAPQAFNEDLHISSVGGEPQFVILSKNLETEYSNAFTASFNYSNNFKKLQTNFLLEGFYTDLENPFTSVSTGASLPNGSILEEVRNGSGAYVAGANFELGISPSSKFTFQMGGTLQQSKYRENQVLFEADGSNAAETDIVIQDFVRNPSVYGYLNTNWKVLEESSIDITGTYTGKMTIPLVISDNGFLQLNESNPFYDLNLKLNHHIDLSESFQLNIFGGLKNIFNSYQNDFDTGATRDSDYIYGPSQPRTFFFGIKFGNLHD
ncbi:MULTISPECIES: TonB-dependent receptor [Mesonia]|uniref:Colicin I receptor n=1 Tax=Mesonia oceanica TaxID=2687242 RepID=A0AC61Y3G1_9FLAO|nr:MULTISPECIES: TonB-dependent receptor [Mesonia]MAN28282.1 TonB-dependent receptor [Mesonia sp.]MAQ41461.1 TonB-dependent receptor [Mesonia sp.]VVU98998.1 Colicin I receptor [Mesonia oceanica]|tara:strand:- start:6096 stop:8453 length:2358 start_codon:yes stop_codon:yes gene_type:complete